MKTIDKSVLAGYNAGIEKNRLRSGIGLIEFERTKELLLENLPKPPAVIYDIGGGYGEYSWCDAFIHPVGFMELILSLFSDGIRSLAIDAKQTLHLPSSSRLL